MTIPDEVYEATLQESLQYAREVDRLTKEQERIQREFFTRLNAAEERLVQMEGHLTYMKELHRQGKLAILDRLQAWASTYDSTTILDFIASEKERING